MYLPEKCTEQNWLKIQTYLSPHNFVIYVDHLVHIGPLVMLV